MFSRRTRALLDLVANVLVVGLQLFFRLESARLERLRREGDLESDEEGEPAGETSLEEADDARTAFALGVVDGMEDVQIRFRWLLVGVTSGVAYRALYDRDVGSIRRSLARRLLVLGTIWTVWIRLGIDDRDISHNVGLGSSIGAVCYRAKYGLFEEPSASE
ncbi:hypothetical protein [Natrarchaeobius chitinivorans]|nr:hypothetical protein [Natrarchaeobius chitinivorans]